MAATVDPSRQRMFGDTKADSQDEYPADQWTNDVNLCQSFFQLKRSTSISVGLCICALIVQYGYLYYDVFYEIDNILMSHYDNLQIFVVLLWYIGAIFGSILCGFNRHTWSARKSNFVIGIILFIAAVVVCLHDFVWHIKPLMAVARFIAGGCFGFTYVRLTAHIGDNVCRKVRGDVSLCIPLANLLSFGIAVVYQEHGSEMKKWHRFYFGTNFALIFIIVITLMQNWKKLIEPVTWYLKEGQSNKAEEVFAADSNNTLTPNELANEIDDRVKMMAEDYKDDEPCWAIFTNGNWKPLLWMTLLRVLNIWTFNAFILEENAFFLGQQNVPFPQFTIVFVRLIALIVPKFLLDFERRKILFICGVGCALCSTPIAVILTNPELPIFFVKATFVAIPMHMFASIGIDPVTHVYSSEAFPLSKRNASLAFLTCFDSICHGLIMFLMLTNNADHLFLLFTYMPIGVAVITIVLFIALPETAGKSIRQCRTAFNSYYDCE